MAQPGLDEVLSQLEQERGMEQLRIFSGNANLALSDRIASELDVTLGKMLSSKFSDGEIRVQVLESARGNDVFLIQPTCDPVNDNIMELCIMLDAFRRASAGRITVVMPYYGYARQDKKIKPREPVTARLIADFISSAGANRVVTLDLHADQIQGFFDLPVDHLYGGPIIGDYLIKHGYLNSDIVVVSPDVAGVPRARALAEIVKAPIAIIAKRRPEPNKVDIMEIIGDVSGKRCVMIDDIIDTGGSVVQGAEALINRGATEVIAACTHAVFSGEATSRLNNSPLKQVIVTDTVQLGPEKMFEKLTILSVAPLLAEAIKRIHNDQSVSALFDNYR
ncbi:MAG: ribose-phosphate pyrophosphokinase [bacterium]